MKKIYYILLVLVLVRGTSPQGFAQECIPQLQSMNLVPFSRYEEVIADESKVVPLDNQKTIYGFSISGVLTFASSSGYFKAVLHTKSGHEYLIYRDFGGLNESNYSLSLNNVCYETAFLRGEIPMSVEFLATDCSFRLTGMNIVSQTSESSDDLMTFAQMIKRLKRDAQLQMVDKINDHNLKNGIPWIAGITSVSELPYEQRKYLFGDLSEIESYGWEYYKGGILSYVNADFSKADFVDTTTEPYVEYFNWTNRHGVNWNSSVYNQWDETGHYTGTCWAYAPKSTIEAFVNIYTGNFVNPNTSIQEIVSCSGGKYKPLEDYYLLQGGFHSTVMKYIQSSGITGESDFPWQQVALPCDHPSKKRIPCIWYKPEKRISFDTPNNEIGRLELMKRIMNNGPICITAYEANHSMSLVGWGVIKPGKFLEYWGTDYITVDENHPLANKVYWIFKNSCGSGWGYNGYACIVRGIYHKTEPLKKGEHSPCYRFVDAHCFEGTLERKINGIDVPIPKVAYDNDGDGYYRWGLSGKPEGLEAPDLQDGDDSDPTIGPMDQYGRVSKLKNYDLYIRDNASDKGVEPNELTETPWESPDIWVRFNNDNGTENQDPTFLEEIDAEERTVYVKVRVHNKGNAPSSPHAKLSLRWTMEQIPLRRYDFFDHSMKKESLRSTDYLGSDYVHDFVDADGFLIHSFPHGDLVDDLPIPVIRPNECSIITFKWVIKNPKKLGISDPKKWKYSLLAEINALDDAYHTPNDSLFYKYVGNNNNVALKSETIKEDHFEPIDDGTGGLISIGDDVLYPPHNNLIDVYGVDVSSTGNIPSEADFRLSLQGRNSDNLSLEGVEGLEETSEPGIYKVVGRECKLAEIDHKVGDTIMVNAQINFLTKQMTNNMEYKYRIFVKDHKTNEILGGRTYIFKKQPRSSVVASIKADSENPRVLRAIPLEEDASYKWKDEFGNTISEGLSIDTKLLHSMSNISLEVVALRDGFKDTETKDLAIFGDNNTLQIVPNPVRNILQLFYPFTDGCRYTLVLVGELGQVVSYSIDAVQGTSTSLDIQFLNKGSYIVSLLEGGKPIAVGKLFKVE